MIRVTRFDDSSVELNADLIQTIEETPDTVITLTSGSKMVVKETAMDVRSRVIRYKRACLGAVYQPPARRAVSSNGRAHDTGTDGNAQVEPGTTA